MAETKTVQPWREILKAACDTPQKRQEMTERVGFVAERTLIRWIRGESNPQKPETIRLLSQAIPGEEMLEALQDAFPDAFTNARQPIVIEQVQIPFEFCWSIIDAYAHVPHASKRWTVFHLVAHQVLPQLDSERAGLLLIYVHQTAQTTAPSILFEESAGSAHWTTRQIQEKTCTEPWLVQAVEDAHPFFIQSCALSHIPPPSCIVRHDLIQGIGFFPVYCSGIIVGGMLLCSAQEDFFTPSKQKLIEKYSCLLSLGGNA
jgi:hypothetical protein